mmetsp:Transcript_58479/g.119608  ORF Transcript_58479/g.119608 Transcript_58479/m.119608 type:complete len:103 (-) Transcript_58479:24-332(-)
MPWKHMPTAGGEMLVDERSMLRQRFFLRLPKQIAGWFFWLEAIRIIQLMLLLHHCVSGTTGPETANPAGNFVVLVHRFGLGAECTPSIWNRSSSEWSELPPA